MYKDKYLTVLIAAGGAGVRFGADDPKQFCDIGGKSMLYAAVEPFLRLGCVDEIIIIAPEGLEGRCRELLDCADTAQFAPRLNSTGLVCASHSAPQPSSSSELAGARPSCSQRNSSDDYGCTPRPKYEPSPSVLIVTGGADRAASVRAGLAAAGQTEPSLLSTGALVLIHDAARPFVTTDIIERVLEAAYLYGAAVPAVSVSDTIYSVDGQGFAEEIPDRSCLKGVQTPQGFDLELIKRAHDHAFKNGITVTDDGMPVLALGERVATVEGSRDNIKITLKEDIRWAAARPANNMRTGIGFDAHRFAEGRALVLGGVGIPFPKGLLGHSDADVLTHALMDAILGALGAGDIGQLFPDSDPKYEGISSLVLLGEVVSLMRERGYELVNADLTVVAEKPRMSEYRQSIIKRLAEALGVGPEKISLKATTTEKLGFTGREEGIAAEAAVLLAAF